MRQFLRGLGNFFALHTSNIQYRESEVMLMKKFAAFVTASLMLLSGCTGAAVTEDDFEFMISWTMLGQTIEYRSEENLLIKDDRWERGEVSGGAEHTTELILSDSEMRTVKELVGMMKLDNYPDAPELYDPGTMPVQPSSDVTLWVRYKGQEKTICAEDIKISKKASSADGIAFMNLVDITLKMITGTEEYLSMPDWSK